MSCAWVDGQGRRCPAPGTVSAGRGREYYCGAHADCHDAAAGEAVVDDYLANGVPRAVSLSDQVLRLAGQSGHDHAAALVAKRKAARQARALELYRVVRAALESDGMSAQQAHERAIGEVDYRARYERDAPRRFVPARPDVREGG